MINQIKYINKAINLEIIKPQLQISLNKTELNNLVTEALANPDTSAAIKRAIAPLLEGAFPQFPEFTNITIGDTEEDGSTIVILKQPRQAPKPDAPIKSMEPLEVAKPATEERVAVATPYVEPTEA